jgi:putative ABC transport system permease protein
VLRYHITPTPSKNNLTPTPLSKRTAGRNFSKTFGTDSTAVIVNETAAKVFGWGQNALGHTLANTDNDGKRKVYHVVGVVKDFHFRSFHEMIAPLVMELGGDYSNMIVRTRTNDYSALLAEMEPVSAYLVSPLSPLNSV